MHMKIFFKSFSLNFSFKNVGGSFRTTVSLSDIPWGSEPISPQQEFQRGQQEVKSWAIKQELQAQVPKEPGR